MKKQSIISTVIYLLAAVFFIVSIIGFTSGMEHSLPTAFLCIGSSMLCIGAALSSRANNKENEQKNNVKSSEDAQNDISENLFLTNKNRR